MPYRHAVKVSERVYRMLLELTKKHNLESPNQLLERSLAQGVTLSQPHGVTPSVVVRRKDYFQWTIRVGEGWEAIEVELNTIQLAKLCKARLLAREVCERVEF